MSAKPLSLSGWNMPRRPKSTTAALRCDDPEFIAELMETADIVSNAIAGISALCAADYEMNGGAEAKACRLLANIASAQLSWLRQHLPSIPTPDAS